MGLIDQALERQAAAPPPRRIDYALMNKLHPKQKAALTRAVRAYEKARGDLDRRWSTSDTRELVEAREKVARVCKAAVDDWRIVGAWPDDWARWQNALDDVLGWNQHIDIGDL